MASKRHSRRRTIPYDLGNPTNWTAAQLRKEISKLGVNLTTSIPKTALIQIYTQLYTASSSTVSQGQSNQFGIKNQPSYDFLKTSIEPCTPPMQGNPIQGPVCLS